MEKEFPGCLSLLEKDPKARYNQQISRFLSLQEDYVPSSSFVERLKRLCDLDSVFACYQLGIIYGDDLTKLNEALTQLEKALELSRKGKEPYLPFIKYRLASRSLQSGQYQSALNLLEELKKRADFPYLARVYNQAGVANYYLGTFYQATHNFKTALALDSEYPEAKFNLKTLNRKLEPFNTGRVYLREKSYPEAEKEFLKAVKSSPDFVMAHHFLGLSYAYQNKLDQAVKTYEKALAISPNYQHKDELHNLLGNAYVNLALGVGRNRDLKIKYFKKGVDEFKTALILNPQYDEAGKNLKNLYQTQDPVSLFKISPLQAGQEFLKFGLFSKAIKKFDQVLKNDRQNSQVISARTKAVIGWAETQACRIRDYDRTITICKKFLPEITDQNSRDKLSLLLGYAYLQKGPEWYEKALEKLKKIPALTQSNYYMGLVYYNQGEYAQAQAQFQEAQKSDLDNPEYFFLLAKLHYYLKNYGLSKRFFQKALEKLEPRMEKAKTKSVLWGALCRKREIYTKDLDFVQERVQPLKLPSDRMPLGLLIVSDTLQKAIYKYIERYLEKEEGLKVVDYHRYSEIKKRKLIKDNCSEEACFHRYSQLTDTTVILVVKLDQWPDQLFISYSEYQREKKKLKLIYDREFPGKEFYPGIKESLSRVSDFFQKQRSKVYCELCPQI